MRGYPKGDEKVKNMGIQKIGTVEYITVKKHARELYLPLKRDLVKALGLDKGDVLKVKIEGRITPNKKA